MKPSAFPPGTTLGPPIQLPKTQKGKGRNKYRAKRTEVDGITFHSKKEAARWTQLRQLEKAGAITELKRQVPFVMHGYNGEQVCKYILDFTYLDLEGVKVAEDTKGVKTEGYRLKRKLFLAEYGREWEHRES